MRGRLDQACEHRRLGDVQFVEALVKIKPRGRWHTVRTRAQIDIVEIPGEYLFFSKAQVQPDCCERLAQFAGKRAVIAHDQHLHELLGYCAAALDDFTRLRVAAQRAHDPHRINPKVAVKAPVLDAKDGLHQAIGEILTRGIRELERSDPPKRVPVCRFEQERGPRCIAGPFQWHIMDRPQHGAGEGERANCGQRNNCHGEATKHDCGRASE